MNRKLMSVVLVAAVVVCGSQMARATIIPLDSGALGAGSGTTTDEIKVPGVSVSAGDMLYLDIGMGTWYGSDLTGVVFNVSGGTNGSWNAYTDFHTTGNNASATWQYQSVLQGTTSGYTLLPLYGEPVSGTSGYWYTNAEGSQYGLPWVGTASGEVRVHPGAFGNSENAKMSSVIAWKSPITGTVDVTYSLTARADGGDGVVYSLTQNTVPEPSSVVLLVTGILGILAYAWRKRK